ncbi:MAG: hypothetical protein ACI867_002565, partial [Glaciecola sp.]
MNTPLGRPEDDAPQTGASSVARDAAGHEQERSASEPRPRPLGAHGDLGPPARSPVDGFLRSIGDGLIAPPDRGVAKRQTRSLVAAATVLAHDGSELVAPALSWRSRAGQVMAATTAKIVIGAVAATATTTGLAATGQLPKPVGDAVSAVSIFVRPWDWLQAVGAREGKITEIPAIAALPGPARDPELDTGVASVEPALPPSIPSDERLLASLPKAPPAQDESAQVICEPTHEPAAAPTDSPSAQDEPSQDPTTSETEPSSEPTEAGEATE